MATILRDDIYIDDRLKQKAEEIFERYGLSLSDGMNLLLKQVISKKNPILIPELDIEALKEDDPDYNLMRETDKEEYNVPTKKDQILNINYVKQSKSNRGRI